MRHGSERVGFEVVTLDGRTAPLTSVNISRQVFYLLLHFSLFNLMYFDQINTTLSLINIYKYSTCSSILMNHRTKAYKIWGLVHQFEENMFFTLSTLFTL